MAESELKRSAGSLIGLGVITAIFGMLAIGLPLATGIAIAILIGVFLLLAGVTQIGFAFRARSWGSGVFNFLIGALTLVAGITLVARPGQGLGFLTWLLAVYLVANGICEIIAAFMARPMKGWGWALFNGILGMVLGVMILNQWPTSAEWFIGLLVGIKILFSGWSMIMVGAAARSTPEGGEAPAG